MILGPDGRPATPRPTFSTPAWLVDEMVDQLSERRAYRQAVVLTDDRGHVVDPSPRAWQVGDTVACRIPHRFREIPSVVVRARPDFPVRVQP